MIASIIFAALLGIGIGLLVLGVLVLVLYMFGWTIEFDSLFDSDDEDLL